MDNNATAEKVDDIVITMPGHVTRPRLLVQEKRLLRSFVMVGEIIYSRKSSGLPRTVEICVIVNSIKRAFYL